ncbi:hypothetical protein DFAR_3820025 [Desulfarculales bacterium]
MVRIASLFSQLLHHFPRTELSALAKEHGAEVTGPRDVPVGSSPWPCSSVIWPELTP